MFTSPRRLLAGRRLPARLAALYVGLWLYGASMSFMIAGGLGVNPWDVFHQGLESHLSLSFGTITAITGAAVLLMWIPLRQRPGLGTVSNVVVIAVAVDTTSAMLPDLDGLPVRTLAMVSGIVVNAFATALYIGAGMGPGPRDGLMTGLVARTGWSIRLTRTGIECTVVLTGWLLGGTLGVGTVLYALGVGPLVQLFMTHLPALRSTRTVDPVTDIVEPGSSAVVSEGTPSTLEESRTGTNRDDDQLGHARTISAGPPEWRTRSELASSTCPPSEAKERTSEPSTQA